MGKILFFLQTGLLFFTLLCHSASAGVSKDAIILTLPESVITKTTKALLPINIDAHSKMIDGDITIIDISNLQLSQGRLACRLHLAGNNLAILTEIAGHQIRLNVGAVEVNFQTDAALRFDAQKQVLYLKPVVRNMGKGKGGAQDEIGRVITALLNGREFPISMKKLDPLVAEAGAKTVTINTQISDIQVKPDLLVLSLTPRISAQ